MGRLLSFPWRSFFLRLYDKAFDTDIFGSAAQIAFYFSFSLFPLLYSLISGLGLILESTDELRLQLFGYLEKVMPSSAYQLVDYTLNETIDGSTGRKITIGLAVAIWSVSAGIDSLRNTLNKVYELKETRPWWRLKLQSLVYTVCGMLLISLTMLVTFYGSQMVSKALDSLSINFDLPILHIFIQWSLIFLILLFAFELFYNLLPNYSEFEWEWISVGTLVGIVIWLIATGGFRVYLQYFNTYNRTYGSLGAVIILMLWLYISGASILIGGAINAVLSELRVVSTKK